MSSAGQPPATASSAHSAQGVSAGTSVVVVVVVVAGGMVVMGMFSTGRSWIAGWGWVGIGSGVAAGIPHAVNIAAHSTAATFTRLPGRWDCDDYVS